MVRSQPIGSGVYGAGYRISLISEGIGLRRPSTLAGALQELVAFLVDSRLMPLDDHYTERGVKKYI